MNKCKVAKGTEVSVEWTPKKKWAVFSCCYNGKFKYRWKAIRQGKLLARGLHCVLYIHKKDGSVAKEITKYI